MPKRTLAWHLVALVLFGIGCSSNQPTTTSSKPTASNSAPTKSSEGKPEPDAPPSKISSVDLSKAYSDDEKAARTKYSYSLKTFEITGKIIGFHTFAEPKPIIAVDLEGFNKNETKIFTPRCVCHI